MNFSVVTLNVHKTSMLMTTLNLMHVFTFLSHLFALSHSRIFILCEFSIGSKLGPGEQKKSLSLIFFVWFEKFPSFVTPGSTFYFSNSFWNVTSLLCTHYPFNLYIKMFIVVTSWVNFLRLFSVIFVMVLIDS